MNFLFVYLSLWNVNVTALWRESRRLVDRIDDDGERERIKQTGSIRSANICKANNFKSQVNQQLRLSLLF
jgi:hypothetical protein